MSETTKATAHLIVAFIIIIVVLGASLGAVSYQYLNDSRYTSTVTSTSLVGTDIQTTTITEVFPVTTSVVVPTTLFSTLTITSTTTQSIGLPAVCLGDPNFGFFGGGAIQTYANSSAILCVEYYYYDSQSKTFSPMSLLSVQGIPKNGSSFNAASNFTITPSVNELTIGGPSNENEGSVVTYTITPQPDSNGTYSLNLGWLAVGQPPNVSSCGVEFLLVSGNGKPSYTNLISMCITMMSTGTLPYLYPAGTIFAKVVGATNGTA